MYVLISGVVMNTVTKGVCRPGDNWGGMLTITDSKCLLDMYCAVNVVQVVYITHEGLEACVQEHPDFEVCCAEAHTVPIHPVPTSAFTAYPVPILPHRISSSHLPPSHLQFPSCHVTSVLSVP